MTNPFDWSYLTRVPKGLEAYGPFAIAFVAIFAVGLIASLVVGRWLTRHFRDHALHRRNTGGDLQHLSPAGGPRVVQAGDDAPHRHQIRRRVDGPPLAKRK